MIEVTALAGAALLKAIAVILAAPAPATAQKVEHVYGPEPSWDEFRRLAEAAIRDKLIDPESARFIWLTGIHEGGIRPFLSGKIEGWAACGSVNANNRIGGYTGGAVFVVTTTNLRLYLQVLVSRP